MDASYGIVGAYKIPHFHVMTNIIAVEFQGIISRLQ